MKDLTELLEPHAASMDEAFRAGAARAATGGRLTDSDKAPWAAIRAKHGFAERHERLLTPPAHNAKLGKASTPSYGLTLQHHRVKLGPRLSVNACPNAGHCVRVCVLNNGNGAYPSVQRARIAKTEFLVRHPEDFSFLLGFELGKAVQKHDGLILFRPNVNSDVAWERLLPTLTKGGLGGRVLSYSYTKRPGVLDTDGWVDTMYRVAYSWNETSDPVKVGAFLVRGGSVAMVTSRKKGDFLPRRLRLPGHPDDYSVSHCRHLDADKTDEWVFRRGVIGDLSAKGRARSLIGKSNFIVQV